MKKVLVLDDDISLLDIIKEVLLDANLLVRTVERGKDILTAIEEYKPDLILLDYLAGDSNGGEICHQIKSGTLTRHIPVIIMSAYPKVFLSLGSYGCDFFLPKPFDLTQLVRAVDDYSFKQKKLCI